MAAPNDPNLWDLINEFKPGVFSLGSIGAAAALRMWWKDWKESRDPEARAERDDLSEKRRWLSTQDRRVRELVEQTAAENDRLRKRLDELEADVDSERESGMGHYNRSLKLYDFIIVLIRDWRGGKAAPDKTPDYDSF